MREAPTSAALQQQSLHDALKGYQEFIQREYFRPELNRLTDWGNMQKKQVKSLKNITKTGFSFTLMQMQ